MAFGVNEKTMNYFKNVRQKLESSKDGPIDGGRLQSGIRLSKTGKEARMNARIDAKIREKEFDESETQPEELDTVDEEILGFIVEREIKDIFGE